MAPTLRGEVIDPEDGATGACKVPPHVGTAPGSGTYVPLPLLTLRISCVPCQRYWDSHFQVPTLSHDLPLCSPAATAAVEAATVWKWAVRILVILAM